MIQTEAFQVLITIFFQLGYNTAFWKQRKFYKILQSL